jgi:glycosyltransferase involved in cell wall biosynthesis
VHPVGNFCLRQNANHDGQSMRIALFDPANLVVPYTDYLATGLVDAGHEVSLWASDFRYSDDRPALGAEVEVLNNYYRLSSKQPMPGVLRRISKAIEHIWDTRRAARQVLSWRPDVIHYQQSPIPILDSFLLGSFTKHTPTVVTLHNITPEHGESKLTAHRYARYLRRFDGIITHTLDGRDFSRRIGFEPGAIHNIRPGIYDHYRRLASSPITTGSTTSSGDSRTVLMFGTLRSYKNLSVALQAFAALPSDVLASTILIIAGRGSPKSIRITLDLAKRLGIESRLDLRTSYVPDEFVHSLYASADVILAPHTEIDLSGVLMVAIAEGKPIVASHVGSFAEYLESGVHGILTPAGDVDAITKALTDILVDDDGRRRKTEAMVQLSVNWPSWTDVARNHVAAYKAVINSRE